MIDYSLNYWLPTNLNHWFRNCLHILKFCSSHLLKLLLQDIRKNFTFEQIWVFISFIYYQLFIKFYLIYRIIIHRCFSFFSKNLYQFTSSIIVWFAFIKHFQFKISMLCHYWAWRQIQKLFFWLTICQLRAFF